MIILGVPIPHFRMLNAGYIGSQTTKNQATGIMHHCQASSMTHAFANGVIMAYLFNKNIIMVFPSYDLDRNDIFETIEKYKCFMLAGLSKIINCLFEDITNSNYDLGSLKIVGTSGEPLNVKVIQNIKSKPTIMFLMSFYSMTEFGGGSTSILNLNANGPYNLNEFGSFTPYVEYKIIDPLTREIVPFGKDGCFCIRSFGILKEYWKDAENTQKVIDKNHWYKLIFYF